MARDFNGSSDYLKYANPSTISGAMTVALWVNPDDVSTLGGNRKFLQTRNSGDTNNQIVYQVNPGTSPGALQLVIVTTGSLVNKTGDGTTVLGTGSWQSAIATWDGTLQHSGIHIYIDGTETGYLTEQDGTGTVITGDGEWWLGKRPDGAGGGQFYDGKSANIGVWNRVLTAGERAALDKGYSPLLIPNGLVFAPDLVRSATDPISGIAPTISGTTVVAHPRTIFPSVPLVGVPSGGGSDIEATCEFIASSSAAYDATAAVESAQSAACGFISSGSEAYDATASVAGSTVALPASDGFSATSGTLDGETCDGSSHVWSQKTGVFTADGSGAIYGSTTPAIATVNNTPASDVESSIDLPSGASIRGVVIRYSDSTHYYYAARNSGNTVLYKVDGGGPSQLDTVAIDPVGKTIKLRGYGDDISVLIDGSVEIGPVTDTGSLPAGECGIIAVNGTSDGLKLDNFDAVAYSPGAISATCEFISSGSQAFDATATVGPAVSADAEFIASGSQAFDATATVGPAVSAECEFIASGSQAFDATATVLSGDANCEFIPSGSQAFDATCTVGPALSADAEFIASGSAAYDATATVGTTQSATAEFIASGSAAYDSTATLGNTLSATCEFISSGSVAYNATASVPTAPSGPLTLPMLGLRTLIAETAEFQAWVSVGDSSAAKDRIYIAGSDSVTRPFALISHGSRWDARRYAGGARNWFLSTGSLRVIFEGGIDAGDVDDHGDAETEFLNSVGGILSAALDLSGSNNYISLNDVELVSGPARSDEDEDEEYYQCVFECGWGPA